MLPQSHTQMYWLQSFVAKLRITSHSQKKESDAIIYINLQQKLLYPLSHYQHNDQPYHDELICGDCVH